MAQTLAPDGNITQTGITGGFAQIDEATASDSDFAYGSDGGGNVLEVSLANPGATPGAGAYTVRVRVAEIDGGSLGNGSGAANPLTVEIYEGATQRASTTYNLTGSWVTQTWTPDLSAVSDWTDVRLRLSDTSHGGNPNSRRAFGVSWASLDVPDGAAAQGLTPSLFTNSQTFNAQAIAASYGLAPALTSFGETFYAPTVAAGAIDLAPSLLTNSQTFAATTVSGVGPSQDLTPSLVNNTQGFPTSALATSISIEAPLHSNAANFPSPTVEPGAVDLTPPAYQNEQTFPSASISQAATISPSLVANAQSFPSASVVSGEVSLVPALITTSQEIFAPSIGASYAAAAGVFVNAQQFFAPALLQATSLEPPLVANDNDIFAPAVSSGTQILVAPLVSNVVDFYTFSICRGTYPLAGYSQYFPLEGESVSYPLRGRELGFSLRSIRQPYPREAA